MKSKMVREYRQLGLTDAFRRAGATLDQARGVMHAYTPTGTPVLAIWTTGFGYHSQHEIANPAEIDGTYGRTVDQADTILRQYPNRSYAKYLREYVRSGKARAGQQVRVIRPIPQIDDRERRSSPEGVIVLDEVYRVTDVLPAGVKLARLDT